MCPACPATQSSRLALVRSGIGVASVAARSAVIAARKGVDAAQPSCALVVKRLPTSLLTKL